jgi:hypothetical protein
MDHEDRALSGASAKPQPQALTRLLNTYLGLLKTHPLLTKSTTRSGGRGRGRVGGEADNGLMRPLSCDAVRSSPRSGPSFSTSSQPKRRRPSHGGKLLPLALWGMYERESMCERERECVCVYIYMCVCVYAEGKRGPPLCAKGRASTTPTPLHYE